MKDNSWYENGELPPAGEMCECTWGMRENWFQCVVIPEGQVAIKGITDSWDLFYIADKDYKFRPTQSERDKLINKTFDAIKKHEEIHSYANVGDAMLGLAIYLVEMGVVKND